MATGLLTSASRPCCPVFVRFRPSVEPVVRHYLHPAMKAEGGGVALYLRLSSLHPVPLLTFYGRELRYWESHQLVLTFSLCPLRGGRLQSELFLHPFCDDGSIRMLRDPTPLRSNWPPPTQWKATHDILLECPNTFRWSFCSYWTGLRSTSYALLTLTTRRLSYQPERTSNKLSEEERRNLERGKGSSSDQLRALIDRERVVVFLEQDTDNHFFLTN